uniref:Putative iodide/myo-inositol/multivitamin symporter n=1 Tax=Ixodes scapularis TaxID=6945 RepID=A0A4D5RR22_IXOSC
MGPLLEYILFGVLTSANLALGLYFSFAKRSKKAGTDEMFLASRSLGSFPLAMSVLASMMSALGVVGFVAHYYYYGFYFNWAFLSQIVVLPMVMNVMVPLLYRQRVTSIFEYVRMRFGRNIGLVSCGLYILMSQSLGAVALYSASVAVSTIFTVRLLFSTLTIGLAGTIYTALGGLRGVVWTDCMQGILILMAPVTVITKVIYDSANNKKVLPPVTDVPFGRYMLDASATITNDENVWACIFGLSITFLYRQGVDQMVVQRYFEAKTLKDAQKIAWMAIALNIFYTLCMSGMAIALVYWFSDCDPLHSGSNTRLDELLPYYVKEYLSDFPGFSGIFLTGVVCAATSTTSSIINSEAAVFYVDVISPAVKMSDRKASLVVKLLAFSFGTFMTVYGVIVPYLGSAVRVLIMFYSSVASPFVAIVLLGFVFPCVGRKGAATAILFATGIQFWQTAGKFYYNVKPPWMPVSIDGCVSNVTNATTQFIGSNEFVGIPYFYQVSAYWSGFISVLFMILVGVSVSLITGEAKLYKRNLSLTGEAFLKLWIKLKLVTPPSDADKLAAQKPPRTLKQIA